MKATTYPTIATTLLAGTLVPSLLLVLGFPARILLKYPYNTELAYCMCIDCGCGPWYWGLPPYDVTLINDPDIIPIPTSINDGSSGNDNDDDDDSNPDNNNGADDDDNDDGSNPDNNNGADNDDNDDVDVDVDVEQ
ncbi:hypothetical protein H4219_005094 [Mycoemilia scoparia]|uniref:Uncharacterized protein n=1 Tax=Mycoemilia scoparia TaxID=417184 RepID=A0A9W7ZPC3_9FUNG|nr:hypothetical protein H4219_005094 [Mycoemilia scoparia]